MSAIFTFPPISVNTTGLATSSNQVLEIAQLTAINANTDSLENLVTASNVNLSAINANTNDIEASLVAIAGFTDSIESNQGLELAQLQAINANTDTLEASLTTLNTNVDQLEAYGLLQSTALNAIQSSNANINNQVGFSLSKLDTLSQKLVLSTFQTSSLIDASVTPIPFVGALTLLASTAQPVYEFEIIEDIGEYMALCTGAPGFELTIALLPLGGGTVRAYVGSAGIRISVKSINGTNITSGKIAINALGLGQP